MSLVDDFLRLDGLDLALLSRNRKGEVDEGFVEHFLAHQHEFSNYRWRVAIALLVDRDLHEVREAVWPKLTSSHVDLRASAHAYMENQEALGFIDASWRAALERQRHTA